jgi:hypothetical protein
MSRDQLPRRCRRLLERLSQPSSARTVIAIGAAIVAMVKCECRDCNGR